MKPARFNVACSAFHFLAFVAFTAASLAGFEGLAGWQVGTAALTVAHALRARSLRPRARQLELFD